MDSRYTTGMDDRPIFHYWPAQRQAALLRIPAHFVHYRLQARKSLSLLNYMDFLKRAQWKGYHHTRKRSKSVKYLDVL